MPQEDCENTGLSSFDSELYFLISKFLEIGPCKKTAEALRHELEEYKLLPKRLDWTGQEHSRSYQNLLETYRHIAPDHLRQVCQRIGPLLDKEVKPSVCGVQSLLGAGRQSLLRTAAGVEHISWPSVTHTVLKHGCPLLPPKNLSPPPNLAHILHGREMSGALRYQHAVPSKPTYSKVSVQCRILGHLSAVYCVTFDRTGQYIFTGADDHLVKVWSAIDGRLLATFRGHSAEITDMAVNYENTMLAAGCCDKIVRVWCLKTGSPVAVLNGHSGVVTSVQFCPLARGDVRYLASTGGDGCVCFWQWNAATQTFNSRPMKFTERSRAGAQMLCSSFSAGGTFLATGNTDHVIRVYCFVGPSPEKICELEAHNDRVDSIQYSNSEDRFVSGSRDGTARIWRYDRQEWKAIILNMNTKLSGPNPASASDGRVTKLKVTMVCWNVDDRYVVTAVNDYSLRVWNSHDGKLLHILQGHEDEIFVLDVHPFDTRIMLSAGHDGNIMLWDLEKGSMIKSFFNMIEGQGHGAVFDCKFSPDGLNIVATDSHGHVLIFGFGSGKKYDKVPTEQFFHTDYRPLIRDTNNYVLDEQTQQPPHLMPPAFLVDIDGNPHPPKYQRLVPGREKCTGMQLIPQIGETPSGDREVLDEPVPMVEEINIDERPHNIEEAIERMQRVQDGRIANVQGEPLRSPGPLQSPGPVRRARSDSAQSPGHSRVGMRWNGEVEGVRQASGNVISRRATTTELKAKRRQIVKEMDMGVLRNSQEWRLQVSEEEIKRYVKESKKKPLEPGSQDSDSGSYIATRRRKKVNHNYRTRATRNEQEETGRNRLTTRALYDTEEEEEAEELSGADSSVDSEQEPWHNNGNSESESSDFSDWAADAGMNLQPPTRPQRQIKQKTRGSLENNNGAESSRRERKSQPKRNKQKKQLFSQQNDITELPDEFRPPEWLTDIIPRKAPYVPQMGDEVIYFRQGHEQYVQTIKRLKVYDINPNKNQPWHKIPNMREQELVKVLGIKYEIRPPRLCCIKLGFLDPETGKLTGGSFSIKYHDMPDVIDFLVLKQYYDTAMRRNWKADDRFRSMIDDAWWMGTIVSQEPFQEIYPDSMYQCFNVQWDNSEMEKMSPWDLEPIDENSIPDNPGVGIPVTQEELKSLMYIPRENEWLNGNREEDCQRIIHCLEQIMEYRIAEQFLTPVDLTAFPIYAMVIEYPIDLSTIKGRLENNFYRRISALQFDVRHVESNAGQFNQAGTPIVKWARIITELILRVIREPALRDVHSVYQELTEGEDFEINVEQEDDEEEESQSTTNNRKSLTNGATTKRRRENTEPVDPNAWKDLCKRLLTTILECDDSVPFRNPVDPIDFPDYHEMIDTPIDLSSVKEELDCDNYGSPHEFAKDMQLIFSNSRAYNTNKRSRIYAMTLRLKALFDEHIRNILFDHKMATKRPTRSGQGRRETQGHNSRQSSFTTRRNRVPRPQLRAEAVASPSKSRSSTRITSSQPGPSRPTRSQGNFSNSNYGRRRQGESSGALRVMLRTTVPRRRIAESDSSDQEDTDEEHPARRSTRNKGKAKAISANGQSMYSTRNSTGSLKRKHYQDFESDQEFESSDEEHITEDTGQNENPAENNDNVKTDSESESKSNCESDSDSQSSSDSSSSSESEEDDDVRRSRRTATRQNTKASENDICRGAGKRPIKRRRLYSEEFVDASAQRRTRSRGKRNVRYKEDSDDSDEDVDNEFGDEATISTSSRGRVRKMTSRARESLLGV